VLLKIELNITKIITIGKQKTMCSGNARNLFLRYYNHILTWMLYVERVFKDKWSTL